VGRLGLLGIFLVPRKLAEANLSEHQDHDGRGNLPPRLKTVFPGKALVSVLANNYSSLSGLSPTPVSCSEVLIAYYSESKGRSGYWTSTLLANDRQLGRWAKKIHLNKEYGEFYWENKGSFHRLVVKQGNKKVFEMSAYKIPLLIKRRFRYQVRSFWSDEGNFYLSSAQFMRVVNLGLWTQLRADEYIPAKKFCLYGEVLTNFEISFSPEERV